MFLKEKLSTQYRLRTAKRSTARTDSTTPKGVEIQLSRILERPRKNLIRNKKTIDAGGALGIESARKTFARIQRNNLTRSKVGKEISTILHA